MDRRRGAGYATHRVRFDVSLFIDSFTYFFGLVRPM
jgi:hypothetical protein